MAPHDTRTATQSGKPVHVVSARDYQNFVDDDGFDVGDASTKSVRVTVAAGSVTITGGPLTLTSRMFSQQPQVGYQIWVDTSLTTNLYILEAPSGSTASSTGFQGIRVPLNAAGNPSGEVQVNNGGTLTFNNRETDTGWS